MGLFDWFAKKKRSSDASIETFADQLIALADRRSLLDVGEIEQEAKHIGEHINSTYGLAGMQEVHRRVAEKLDRQQGGRLERAWNGVGQWLS